MESREERGRGLPGERGEEGVLGTEGGGQGGRGGTGGEGGQAETSPRFNRALIAVGVIVLVVITTLLLLIQEQIQTTRSQIQQDARLAARVEEQRQELILEIRAQSRLSACLTLKVAKRHGINISGLDSPACKVFPNGAVVFPGSGSLLDSTETQPEAPGQPGQPGGNEKESPGPQPQPPSEPPRSPGPPDPPGPPGPPDGPGPMPRPTPSCIDLPPPLEDVCVPVP